MRRLIATSLVALAGLLAIPVALAKPTTASVCPAGAKTYTVTSRDSSGLAFVGRKCGVSWQVVAGLNNLRAPYTIFPGQTLKLPGAAEKPAGTQVSAPTTAMILGFGKGSLDPAPTRREVLVTGGYRIYTAGPDYVWEPGIDPVKGAGTEAGPRAVKYVLDGMGGATLDQARSVWGAIQKAGYNAAAFTQRDGTLAVRTDDGTIIQLAGQMVGGHSVVQFDRLHVKGQLTDTRATVLFSSGGKVVVKMAICDNILPGRTPKPVKIVTPPGREPTCLVEGSHVAEVGLVSNRSARYKDVFTGHELACLRDVGNGWEVGPMIYGSWSAQTDDIGGGEQYSLRAGIRVRKTLPNGAFIKINPTIGVGGMGWSMHTHDVRVPEISGMDIGLTLQVGKQITERMYVEGLAYVALPITNRKGSVVGKGWFREEAVTRPATGGLTVRVVYDINPKLPFLLEMYAGVFGVEWDRALSVRASMGVTARDRSAGAWVGLRINLANGGQVGFFGGYVNWGGKALYLDGKGRQDEVAGAKAVSIDTPVDLTDNVKIAKVSAPSKVQTVKTSSGYNSGEQTRSSDDPNNLGLGNFYGSGG